MRTRSWVVTGVVVMMALGPGASSPSGIAETDRPDAVGAVASMMAAFTARSPARYVAWMSDDFVFVSDEEGFASRYPSGMSLEDERRFATHLFEGGGSGPNGEPLPVATRVEVHAAAISLACSDGAEQHVVVRLLGATITFADGSTMDVGPTLNELDVVLTESGWRVRRWQEIHPHDARADAFAQRAVNDAATTTIGIVGERRP